VQSLNGDVETIKLLLQQLLGIQLGKRFRRQESTTLQDMEALATSLLLSMDKAYEAIYPCCTPTTICNETSIKEANVYMKTLRITFRNLDNTTLNLWKAQSEDFFTNFTTKYDKIENLNNNCENNGGTTIELATTTTPPTTIKVPVTTTNAYTCCEEYAFFGNPVCKQFCDILELQNALQQFLLINQGRKNKFRMARSAVDPASEQEFTRALKESYLVEEVCIDFSLCNTSKAKNIKRRLANIGEEFVNNGLRNFSSTFKERVNSVFRNLTNLHARARLGHHENQCPNWIVELGRNGNLDDAVVAIICVLHNDSTHNHRKIIRRKREDEDCTDNYIEVMNKINILKFDREKLIDLLAKLVEDRDCVHFNDTSFESVKKKYGQLILLIKQNLSKS